MTAPIAVPNTPFSHFALRQLMTCSCLKKQVAADLAISPSANCRVLLRGIHPQAGCDTHLIGEMYDQGLPA